MKKSLALIFVFCLVAGSKSFAESSSTPTTKTSDASATSSTSSSSLKTKSSKKKKAGGQTAPAAITPTATPETTSTRKVVGASSLFSANVQLYDRLGAPGDLRQAISLAAQNYGSFPRHDRSLFLWLGKLTSGDAGKSAYIRLSIESVELGGAKKPWIVLIGTVEDQSGSDCRIGNSVEVAVDFRDVKVDYEGTKLGEVQKGNDIADQVHEVLMTHPAYQWVVLADDKLKAGMDDKPAFLVKAKDGYSLLETLESHR